MSVRYFLIARNGVVAPVAANAVLLARDLDARRQAQHVPLPRSGQRLVEVVDVENQVALGRPVTAEVHEMRIATQLHAHAGDRHRREVGGHNRRGAAKKSERRRQHASVTDGNQLRYPCGFLLPQDLDRIGPIV